MSGTLRRAGPLAVTFIAGLLPFLSYYLIIPVLDNIASAVVDIASRILNYAFILSIATLFLTHIRRAIKQESVESIYSGLLVISLIATALSGILFGSNSESYNWIITYIRNPPEQALMVTMLLFWVSSFYRIYRIKSFETGLMTFAFLVVIITVSPSIGTVFPQIVSLKDFINESVYTRIGTSIRIGAAIGSIILGIRVLLGRERGYLRLE
jgi:hypothetical protein